MRRPARITAWPAPTSTSVPTSSARSPASTCAPASSSKASSLDCTPVRFRASPSSSPNIASTFTGDDLKDLDWNVYAKTDKYYLKKFQAETNVTGYLVMDLSASMAYTYRQEMTKFEYAICLAAALGYLMTHQQDPVGLVTFDTAIRASLPPRSKRTHLGNILSLLAGLKPSGQTDAAASLHQLASMVRSKGLVMIFSDLLTEPEPVMQSAAPPAAPRP